AKHPRCRAQTEFQIPQSCDGRVSAGRGMLTVEGSTHQTALHVSVRRRALPAVHILTSYGADVHAVDSSGMTPLHTAAAMCHEDIMKSARRAVLDRVTLHSGDTPLHVAAVTVALRTPDPPEDHLRFVSALFGCGADPDILNRAGLSPLHMACVTGTEALVDLLLRHGADINRRSAAGENCLFLFLNHRPNVKKKSLLVKLLGLVTPLAVCSQQGRLPAALTEPCFSPQRDRLLRLTQQPKRLKDICKTVIYLKYVGKQDDLREVLPTKLHDFVFNQWENIENIYFDTNKEEF
uniref:Uncharacterized protein n=1 Tax=Salarias fasciatus TaxID=181472 RepID=A0A672GMT3_SALFA